MAHVLIIDDDEDFGRAAAKVLEGDGHDVDIELDIENGLASIDREKPDLLILDVMFPEDATAGFEAARKIKEMGKDKDMPILILTAVNQRFPLGFGSRDADDRWLPVSDFLEKPVDFDVLLQKVSNLLQ